MGVAFARPGYFRLLRLQRRRRHAFRQIDRGFPAERKPQSQRRDVRLHEQDGGLLLSFTWNASELGTADGSLVECKVVGTKSGGSPGNRNTVDVGAVEWNVAYDTGGTVTLAGAAAGGAAVSGGVVGEFALAGLSAGLAAVSGVLVSTLVLAGASGASVGVSADLHGTFSLAGTPVGAATVVGNLTVTGGAGEADAVSSFLRMR